MPESFSGANAFCPSCGNVYFKKESWQKLCLRCYLATKGKAAPTATAPAKPEPLIPPDMLRRLIQLCHPDRHGGSECAHKTTQWLLSIREQCTH